MAALLLLSTVATAGFLLAANRSTAERLTEELRRQIRERVQAHVRSILDRAVEINRTNAGLLRSGAIGFASLDAVEELQRHLARQASRHPEMSFVFVGTPEGGAVGAGRRSDGLSTVDATTFDATVGPIAGSRFEWSASPAGERLSQLEARVGFDARSRPWFRAAVERRQATWSPTYVFFAEQTVAIAASEPVFDDQGRLLAVVGVDLSLAGLGRYLRSLATPSEARLFVAESDGRLVASSDPQRSDLRNPLDEVWQRRPARDSSDPMIAAAAQVIDQAGSWQASNQLALEGPGANHGGPEELLVDVVPVQGFEDLDWLVVLASSRATLLEEVRRQTRWSLVFAATTLVLLLALGALISDRVTRPAEALSDAARGLSRSRRGSALPRSRIVELERLRSSFEQMEQQVDRAFLELEERVEERTRDLQTARSQAEEASRAKSAFLSRVSHELRTPLTSVRGYLRVLQRRLQPTAQGAGDHQTIEALEAVDASSAQLQALVDDLLDYQRSEEGRLPVALSRFELRRLFDELARGFAAQARAKGLTFETHFEVPRELTLLSDRRRLGQIVTNLLANAVKYTRSGGVHLEVVSCPGSLDRPEASEREEGTDWLRISVHDSGPGIAQEFQQDVFSPFTRGERSSVPGVGLGLAIAKELCEALGYEIQLASRPGSGSSFHLWIPGSAVALPGEAAGLTTTAELPTLDFEQLPSLRVLVADDAPQLRRLVQLELQTWGVEVACAEDGNEAVSRWSRAREGERPFDALLLDWQMPGLDGLEVTRVLRARGSSVPIAAITAAAFEKDRAACLDAGVDQIFAKPLDFDSVRSWLQDVASPGETRGGTTGAPAEISDTVEIDHLRREVVDQLGEQLQSLRVLQVRQGSSIEAASETGAETGSEATSLIRSEIGSEAIEEARRLLHRLVGTVGSFGVGELQGTLEELERQLRRPREEIAWSAVRECLASLEAERLAFLDREDADQDPRSPEAP